jgi:hypothetical protein
MSRTVTRTVGDITDPEFRRERAAKAAGAAHSIDSYVRRIVAHADELTPEHSAILGPLLPPVPAKADANGGPE